MQEYGTCAVTALLSVTITSSSLTLKTLPVNSRAFSPFMMLRKGDRLTCRDPECRVGVEVLGRSVPVGIRCRLASGCPRAMSLQPQLAGAHRKQSWSGSLAGRSGLKVALMV